MRKLKNIFALAVLASAILAAGCNNGGGSTSNGGFKVSTKVVYNSEVSLFQGGVVSGQHLSG